MILEDRVAPWAWLDAPWRAWHDLNSERSHTVDGIGGGMGPLRIVSRPQGIPWSALHAWCDRAGYDDDDREFVVGLVLTMDRAFLNWRNDRIAKELKAMSR